MLFRAYEEYEGEEKEGVIKREERRKEKGKEGMEWDCRLLRGKDVKERGRTGKGKRWNWKRG